MRTALLSALCAFVLVALGALPAAGQAPAKPGAEHEKLRKFEGEWDAKVSFAGGESNATATYKVGLGGFWLQSHFKSEFGGMPFEGRGLTGYDPHKKKYVSTWADSMEPYLTVMEGNFAADGKTFTETGEGVGHDGKPQKMKSVYEFKDKDSIVFTMYKVADGKDEQMMQITYKRKK
jgi:Protein of unknown function (DUF1579)